MKELKSDVSEMKASQERTDTRLSSMEGSLARMENDMGTKIAALFDGYTLRGEQIERLQEHLDTSALIQSNPILSYVVGKVAQHDRNFVRLRKKTQALTNRPPPAWRFFFTLTNPTLDPSPRLPQYRDLKAASKKFCTCCSPRSHTRPILFEIYAAFNKQYLPIQYKTYI